MNPEADRSDDLLHGQGIAKDVITIEVTHARPDKQVLLRLEVEKGTTVEQAIDLSAIHEEFADLEVDPAGVGIFSRKVALDQVLVAGDRVEIYRPLIADPKEIRRERALKEKG